VKLLLDTHVVLWATTDPDRLTAETRSMLEDGTHEVAVSIVTALLRELTPSPSYRPPGGFGGPLSSSSAPSTFRLGDIIP
jgi:hypothetical protein